MSIFNKLKEHQKNSEEQANIGFQTMLNGKWGLAKTFWLYWFLLYVVIGIFCIFVEKTFQILLLDVASIYVGITAFKGVRNTLTATNKGWRITALVIIGLFIILDVLGLLWDLFQDQIIAYLG
ncbi:hypothetical protein N0H69_15455 [Yersinia alsatica]|uniref:Uncharacterized protein n=1 Tax=Yersinia alsatica TaxID=2890317 RepID=A0ABY5UPM6_9GAMM|nr:hypothetical protein [Yersinia alsatica]UWM44087.1 hypothetical protein N0H69_15455 [Yersinia alsatica]CNK95538.1 Uncharacterised protein [Yersinia frederiksenii]CNL12355.1 Uncharacterised protein [Yersinia frederiksenii]